MKSGKKSVCKVIIPRLSLLSFSVTPTPLQNTLNNRLSIAVKYALIWSIHLPALAIKLGRVRGINLTAYTNIKPSLSRLASRWANYPSRQ